MQSVSVIIVNIKYYFASRSGYVIIKSLKLACSRQNRKIYSVTFGHDSYISLIHILNHCLSSGDVAIKHYFAYISVI